MNLVSVRCQNCGAPLQVDDAVRFVTCQFCKTELVVERTDSAVFTQKIGEIHARTAQMVGDLGVIRLQNDLEKLDREWQMERERYMVTGKNGERQEPGVVVSLIGGLTIAAFGVFWFVMTSQQSAPSFLPLIGLLVAIAGGASSMVGVAKASERNSARVRYEQQRATLTRQLAAAQNVRE